MIAADTSALVTLATIDLLDTFFTEFDVHTTETVVDELEVTAEYDDSHGDAAKTVLDHLDRITVHRINSEFSSSRVDAGEGSCACLTQELDMEFLITDDLRAVPELQTIVDARVAISPIILKALANRDVLTREEALGKLETAAEQRDWLESPIYRKAKGLF